MSNVIMLLSLLTGSWFSIGYPFYFVLYDKGLHDIEWFEPNETTEWIVNEN